ncbi:MAG: AAA family ATPase [Fervidicoccaceae archaeon]
MGKAVVIAGYPGTGKSTIAGELRKMFEEKNVIEVDEEAKKLGMFSMYDARRLSHIYDEEYLMKWLERRVRETEGVLFVFSIFSCILPKELVSSVIVLRMDRDSLERRLRDRGWSDDKIQENLEAMEMGEIEDEASECYGEEKVAVINTSATSPLDSAKAILKIAQDAAENRT